MEKRNIAQLVRQARKQQGLTLEDLSDMVGLTSGALSHIESGRRLPSPKVTVAIAQALGLDEQELLGALDDAHRERRYESLTAESLSAPTALRAPRHYEKRDVSELFAAAPPTAPASNRFFAENLGSVRDAARWGTNPSARIEALDELAETASRAIRTLRGLLDDEDPAVRREARRLLLELDVRVTTDDSNEG